MDLPRRRHGVRPRNEQERANAEKLDHQGGITRAFSHDDDGMLRFDGYDHEREIIRVFLQSDGGEFALQTLCDQLQMKVY